MIPGGFRFIFLGVAARSPSPAQVLAPYWQVARRTFQRHATYRGATLATMGADIVFGTLRASVLLAVYAHRDSVGGLDATAAVTFAFVSQAFLPTIGVFGALELSDRIRTGDVATDLYRPLQFQGYWLAQDLGRFVYDAVALGLPAVTAGALLFHLRFPAGPTAWAVFAVALVLAELVSFSFRYLVALAGFWLVENRGLIQFAGLLMQFFGGIVVPITFFPGGLERVARTLPFPAMIQLPVELFVGVSRAPAGALGLQALWGAALFAAGHAVSTRAVRKVVVQGG